MTQRYMSMPAINKRVPLGAFVAAIKIAKANPGTEFKTGLTCWWPCTGAEIMEQFREGMVERINSAVRYLDRGITVADSE